MAKIPKRRRSRKKGYQVFLSHSHKDQWVSEVLKEKIEAVGISVWLDAVDIPGGGNVKERVKRGMNDSDECAVLLSPASRQSEWVIFEMGMAEALDRWVTPILLHVPDDDLPGPIREAKPVNINEFNHYLEQLTIRSVQNE